MLISDQIIAVLDDICQRFGVAIDWSQQNVLPYLQELAGKYINYEICTSVAWCVMVLIVLIAIYVLNKAALKSRDDDLYIPVQIISFFVVPFAIVTMCVQIFDIIECCTIPEKTLIEFVSTLMK